MLIKHDLTAWEKEFLKEYRELDEYDKALVRELLNALLQDGEWARALRKLWTTNRPS